jgi:carbon monoxide dehydrogenase subunit G
MEFSRTAEVAAPFEQVWGLVSDVPTVAACIPGVSNVEMSGPTAFTCKLVQRVGSAKANFDLTSNLEVDEAAHEVVVTSEGRDRALGSTVNARQTFRLRDLGETTEVAIQATVQMTGRIATFGHRIIASKTEQVTMEGLANLNAMLGAPQSG